MTARYMPAPDVETIAKKLIKTIPRHQDLKVARIDYVFIEEAPKSKGRAILGRARKVSGLNAYLAGASVQMVADDFHDPDPMFVIEIAHDYWVGSNMTDAQREALVDHELCHCKVEIDRDTGEHSLSTVGHEIEEFSCVVERHGLWSNGLTLLGQAISEQLSLDLSSITGVVITPPEGSDDDDGGQTA